MLLERWGVEVLLLFLGLNSWDDGGAPFCAEEDRVRDGQTRGGGRCPGRAWSRDCQAATGGGWEGPAHALSLKERERQCLTCLQSL